MLDHDPTLKDPVRDRVSRLFRFVQAFNERRNPPVRDLRKNAWALWFKDIPTHDNVELITTVNESDNSAGSEDTAEDEDAERVLLRCERPIPTEPPSPPADLAEWLGREWRDARAADPQPIQSKNVIIDGETIVETFADSGARMQAFAEYLPLWTQWARQEETTLAAIDLFGKLYELYGWLQRDADKYELVLCDGLLSWAASEEIFHPLLTIQIALRFDPEIPQFTIHEVGSSTALYHSVFNNLDDVDGELIARMRTEVEDLGLHPLGNVATTGFLRSVAARLSKDGRYIEESTQLKPAQEPVIVRSPLFMLRDRTSGLAQAISAVVEAVTEGGDIPQSLTNIVGIQAPAAVASGGEAAYDKILDANADENVLFTRAANAEQLLIAQALEREDCVLVQGPPGTGKTHTIANLLGHLLAQGKTVLVTSQTSKALKVLKEKVVPELQALCVSVIDTVEDDKSLRSSIDGIVERIGFADEVSLERDIERFQRQRKELITRLRGLKSQLKTARLDENVDIVVAGEPLHPSVAAKFVASGVGTHDWIPSPVSLGSFLPLPPGEIAKLYATNLEVTRGEETAIGEELPDLTNLPSPQEFASLTQEYRALEGADRTFGQQMWSRVADGFDRENALDDAFGSLREAVTSLDSAPQWTMKLVEVGLVGLEVDVWESLLNEITELQLALAGSRRLLVSYNPETAKRLNEQRASLIYSEIASEVGRTGKIPGFISLVVHPEWEVALKDSRVNGSSKPSTQEHFQALSARANLSHQQDLLMRRWTNQVEAIGGPRLEASNFLEGATQLLPLLRSVLRWGDDRWLPALSNLQQCGLNWNTVLDSASFDHLGLSNIERIKRTSQEVLPKCFAAELQRRRWKTVNSEVQTIVAGVSTWKTNGLTGALAASIANLDAGSYGAAYAEVARLRTLELRVRERHELLARLSTIAPGWSDAIRNRVGPHAAAEPPGPVEHAWRWRQYNDEIERRSRLSLPEIVRQMDVVRSELAAVTIDLVDRRAWLHQKQRTSLKEKNALFGFASAKRQYGRGFGKRAALLLREQRRLMSEARSAVPVWIMSINKAVEVFNPRTTRFDVVIIDEASQSDVTSLVALYLGRQVLVVGDDEQVSPADIGNSVEGTQQLIDAFLNGIPNHQQYTGQLSLYDIAKWSFGGAITLLEHFRSVPDIIRFSNQLSYGGKIRPLREVTEKSPRPSVVEYRVSGIRTGDVNEVEAKAIVALVKAAIEQPEYENKTIGVLSLLADSQARYIEQLLYRVIDTDEISNRRIIVGNAAQFQGDERDIMFLSLVQSSDGLLPLVSARPYQQRFNVAASRAKDQMWVVHSLNPSTNLQQGDLRRKLIEHVQDPGATAREATAALARAESPFEVDVIKRLSSAGYHLRSNYRVGSYRIDIVVQGRDGRKLAIECDGARYHGAEELDYDMQRQADLERLDWRFVRIRGTLFYRDSDAAMLPVFERLAAMGIEPLDDLSRGRPVEEPSDLLERVKLRAQELLSEIDLALEPGEMLLSNRRKPRRQQFHTESVLEGKPGAFGQAQGNGEDPASLFGDADPGRPVLPYRDSIEGHSARALGQLTRWVYSRGSSDSIEDLARQVSIELGYRRFGAKIANRLMPIARRVINEGRDAAS